MICSNCGKEIPDGVKFCPECGAPAASEPFIPAEPAAPAVPPYPSDPVYPSEPVQQAYPQPSAPYAPPQTYPGQQTYRQPVYAAPAQKTNGLAVAGFVCSLASFILPYVGVVTAIVGLILSIIGIGQIKKSGEKGRGLAIAGIIIGALIILLTIVAVILLVYFFSVYGRVYMTDFQDILPYLEQYMT